MFFKSIITDNDIEELNRIKRNISGKKYPIPFDFGLSGKEYAEVLIKEYRKRWDYEEKIDLIIKKLEKKQKISQKQFDMIEGMIISQVSSYNEVATSLSADCGIFPLKRNNEIQRNLKKLLIKISRQVEKEGE